MNQPAPLTSLNCPRCGGMIPIPEGQRIVRCPFCELRSIVSGETGLPRYQVAAKIDHTAAQAAARQFLQSSRAIQSGLINQIKITEVLPIAMPYWFVRADVVAWVLGFARVKSGKHTPLVPRERGLRQTMQWNAAACDTAELNVPPLQISPQALQPFNLQNLSANAIVFEPTIPISDALTQSTQYFEQYIARKTDLDKITQNFVRYLSRRVVLVYYPLWVVRYEHAGRAFQIVIDAVTGEVLYGKAPGNSAYRAAALVFGMSATAGIWITIGGMILSAIADLGQAVIILLLIIGSLGAFALSWGWRAFRYGEHYEYRKNFTHAMPSASAGQIYDIIRQFVG